MSAAMPNTPAVPAGYGGVWQRTLLETPTHRDDTTFVRWLQTPHWHADLRVPAALPRDPAHHQGFAGSTEVETSGHGEVCHWHREVDLQPPGPTPDAGWMVFETTERAIETGVHGVYREVWERLPESIGAAIALGRTVRGGVFQERLLLAGRCLMRVRARAVAWPALQPGDTLAALCARHPAEAAALLDVEISYGLVTAGQWAIERSSLPALEGRVYDVAFERTSATEARVRLEGATGAWTVVDWEDAPPRSR
jgi:hypothetical protein